MTINLPSDIILVDLKSTKKGVNILTDTEKVKQLISESGLKLQHIASKLGITRYSLSLKLDNKSEFKTSEVGALCELLHVGDLEMKEKLFFKRKVD